jgi:hypothetical protein
VAFFLTIRKRPGGKLPPPRKLTGSHPYHLVQQAKNDYEEKSTPLPDLLKFWAKYLKAPPVVAPTDPPKKDDKK